MPSAAIIPPRVPLVDSGTGIVSRDWYRYFLALSQIVGAGAAVLSLGQIEAELAVLSAEIVNIAGTVYRFTSQASPFSIATGLQDFPSSVLCLQYANGVYTQVGIGWTITPSLVLTFDTGGDPFTGIIVVR